MDSDYVDQAIDGWAKQWPKLRTAALEITGRLDRIARHLDRLSGDVLSETGVTGRDLEVLGALRRSGKGLPASECARAAMLTSGGMTGQADRLAKAGLLVRRPDPEDRRAVVMTLTDEGNHVVEEAIKAYLQAADDVVDVLDHNERLLLAELLRKVLVRLENSEDGGARTQPARPQTEPKGPMHAKLRFQPEPGEAVTDAAG